MQAAAIGHNNPPSEVEVLAQRLVDREARIRARLDGEVQAPATITDDKHAGDVTDTIKRVAAIAKDITDAHKDVKAPYLECSKACDNWKNRLIEETDKLRAAFSKPLQAFLDAKAAEERARQLEQARVERERAEALAAEAEEHSKAGIADTASDLMDAAVNTEALADRIATNAALAKPSELARSRSLHGSTASQKMVWVGEITSYQAIDLNALRGCFNQDDVQKAINAFVRGGGRELDGVKIFEKAQLSVR